jgi:hypothetical protein
VDSLGDQGPTLPTRLLRSDFYVSSLIGLPLLTKSKAWASLINNPAPLSSLLGLPVLMHGSRRESRVEAEPPRNNAAKK